MNVNTLDQFFTTPEVAQECIQLIDNLDKYELREKIMVIFYELYQRGIEEKLYKEVAVNV